MSLIPNWAEKESAAAGKMETRTQKVEDLTLHPNLEPTTLLWNQSAGSSLQSQDAQRKNESFSRATGMIIGWRSGVTVGGKGELLLRGNTATTNKTTIICFISLPFLWISSSACIYWSLNLALPRQLPRRLVYTPLPLLCVQARSSLTSLCVYDAASRVTNQLSIFSAGLMMRLTL